MEYENRHLSETRRSGTPAAFADWPPDADWLAGFAAFTRHLPGAWWVKSGAGVYLYANETAEANLSAPHGGVVGKTDFDLLPEKLAAHLRVDDEKVVGKGEAIEALEQLRDDHGKLRSWFSARFPVQVERERCSAGFAIEISTKGVGKGTGQGLPLARMIVVDKHQGSLTFETQLGAGTTFHIKIPVQAASAS